MDAASIKVSDVLVNGFVVMVLLLSTGALVPLLLQGGNAGAAGTSSTSDLLTEVLWLGIYGVSFLLLLRHLDLYFRVALNNKFAVLLVGVAVVSVLWSVAPEATLRRSVGLVGITLLGIYIAARFTPYQILKLLAWSLGLAALMSLIFVVALPSYGVETDVRGVAWQGVYVQKNILGRVMSLGVIVFLMLALGAQRYRWLAYAMCGLSALLLLMSDSIAATISLLALLLLLPVFYVTLRSRYSIATPFFVFAVLTVSILVALVVNNAESVLEALGRDPTLTGRTEIWGAVIEMIRQRPWGGYGYGGFWLGWEGEAAYVWLRSGILAGHAHNGLLNIWLDLGLLGVAVFVLSFLSSLRRAVFWARSTKAVVGFWPLLYLSFVAVYNVTESSLLYNDVFWVLYVALSLSPSFDDAEAQEAARASRAPYSLAGSRTSRAPFYKV